MVKINITILVIQMVMFLVIFWEIFEIVRKKNKCENIKKMTAQFIKCYKNILMIPAFYISFVSIKSSHNVSKIVIPVVNILIGIFFCYIKEMCCVSYRFRVRNYFRKF
jgi:ACR3 family arsenite efflux pump ArsB